MLLSSLLAASPDLQIALEAGLAGARLLEEAWQDRRRLDVNDKGLHDYVTQLDRESEALICARLSSGDAPHAILAEEGGGDVEAAARFWVVDPLDGTSNFIHHYPAFAVSIGLLERVSAPRPASEDTRYPAVSGCRSHLGVIVDVCQRDVYLGERGRGAWKLSLDGFRLPAGPATLEALHIGSATRLEDAFLASGFPVRYRDLARQYLNLFELVLPSCAGLRRGGSAALDLAYTASGVFDGFFELFLAPWDLAAGLCLVEEAGGRIDGLKGDPVADGHLVAGNPALVSDLGRRLQGRL